MTHLVFFEVTADDLERAAQFYRDVFGWEIARTDGTDDYYDVETGSRQDPGIPGGVVPRYDAYESVINTYDVEDIDESAKKIAEAGGEVLAPRITIPGVGYVQYCQDTEGNTFGIMQVRRIGLLIGRTRRRVLAGRAMRKRKDIAVIGMSGRFPGAPDLSRFWRNLCDGVESISRFSDDELLARGTEPHELANPQFVRAGSHLDDVDLFDAAFFGINPREAEIMDPAAAPVPGVRVGSARGRRLRPARARGLDRRLCRLRDEQLSPPACTRNPDLRRAGRPPPGPDRQRQGLPHDPRLVQARPERAERQRADDLLDLARRGRNWPARACRTASATWRWPAASRVRVPQKSGYLPRAGRHLLARRPLPRLRCATRRASCSAAASAIVRAQARSPTRSPTATRSTP